MIALLSLLVVIGVDAGVGDCDTRAERKRAKTEPGDVSIEENGVRVGEVVVAMVKRLSPKVRCIQPVFDAFDGRPAAPLAVKIDARVKYDLLMRVLYSLGQAGWGSTRLSINGNATLGEVASEPARERQPDERPPLLLTVAIAPKGFFVAATGAVFGDGRDAGTSLRPDGPPTLPLKGGKLDQAALKKRLDELKAAFPDEQEFIVAAEPKVTALDALTTMKTVTALFPKLILGQF